MPNILPIVAPILKKRKFEKIVKEAGKEREDELKNFAERGFESQNSYKTFLNQRDKSRAVVYTKAKKLQELQAKSQKSLKETEQKFGKDSDEVAFERMKQSAVLDSAKNDFQETLKMESQKLQAVTPATLNMSGAKKAGIFGAGILAGIAGAVGAFYFMNNQNNSKPKAPTIDVDPEIPVDVVDPYTLQIPDEVVVEIIKDNPEFKDMTEKEIKEKIQEVISSKDYQTEVEKIASETNKKIDAIVDNLKQSYLNIDDFMSKNCSGMTERQIVGLPISFEDGFDGFDRISGESVVTFMVRALQHLDSYQETVGAPFVSDFKTNFPNLVKLYGECGAEINPENIFFLPDEVGYSKYIEAIKVDLAQTGHELSEFKGQEQYKDLQNSYGTEDLLRECMGNFKSQLNDEQLREIETLFNSSDKIFDNYISTVGDYNIAIANLQKEFFENLSFDDLTQDALANMILGSDMGGQDIDTNSTFDDILNHIQTAKSQKSSLSDIVDSVSDDALDAVSKVLDDSLSM